MFPFTEEMRAIGYGTSIEYIPETMIIYQHLTTPFVFNSIFLKGNCRLRRQNHFPQMHHIIYALPQ